MSDGHEVIELLLGGKRASTSTVEDQGVLLGASLGHTLHLVLATGPQP